MMEREKKTSKKGRVPRWSLGIIISDPASSDRNVGKIIRLSKKDVRRATSTSSGAGVYPGPEVEELMRFMRTRKRR